MAPRLGVYLGHEKDASCPGDNITYEVMLKDSKNCSVECIPELSFFKGGQPPWHCEGTWEADDTELLFSVTKQDVTGPKKDSDHRLKLQSAPNGAINLVFRGTPCSWRSPPPEDDKLKLKAEELAKASAETEAKKREVEARQEELSKMRAEAEEKAREEQEELQRLREEVQQQQKLQEEEAAQAEEERVRLANERQEQEALFAKQKEELEALAKAKEEIQRSREEARRKQEQQQKDLEEQQSILERERLEVEKEREAREAERTAKQAELEAQRAEILRQRQEVERQREEEEELRQVTEQELKIADEELRERHDILMRNEQALTNERQQILRSKQSLAVVQAHVVSWLGKEGGKQEINLDACDEPEAEDLPDKLKPAEADAGESADVWNMDWTSVEGKQKEEQEATGDNWPIVEEHAGVTEN